MNARSIAALLALLSCLAICSASPLRFPFSLYPSPLHEPSDTILVVNGQGRSDDEMLVLSSLMGVVARDTPSLFIVTNGAMKLWLDDLVTTHDFALNVTLANGTLSQLVSLYLPRLEGFVLCNSSDLSTLAAVSFVASSSSSLLSCPTSTAGVLTGLGLPLMADLTQITPAQLLSKYGSSAWSNRSAVFQAPSKISGALADYAVMGRTFATFDATDASGLQLRQWASLLGWGDSELGLVQTCSNQSIQVNAADYAADLSLLCAVGDKHGVSWPIEQLPIDTALGEAVDDVHTVTFLFSDGDNIQALLNTIGSSPDYWGSPGRGMAPISWTMSPAMLELAPSVLQYFYRTAARNGSNYDFFVAAPSGLGYIYPDETDRKTLSEFAELSGKYMSQAGMSILNVIAIGEPESSSVEPLLETDEIDAVFWYLYSNYAGLNGSISWWQGKPCIGARALLWDGFNTPQSLAEFLNSQPTTPSSPAGYSLIAVHLWDQSVSSVLETIGLLGDTVEVVAADEFVRRVVLNVPH